MASTTQGDDDYTCHDARTFDPVLRLWASDVAQFLFEENKASLSPGSTLENVEFDTVCAKEERHGPDCQIRYVTIRRRSDGPNGDDVVMAMPHLTGAERMAAIQRAHKLAYTP